MARKAILKDQDGIEILPITRAELILDSEGKPAFRSASLLATDADPGLMSQDDKKLLRSAVIIQNTTDGIALLTDVNNTPIHPRTAAVAVDIKGTNLETFLEEKLTLDERPTKNSINGVQSGGVYAELEDVVGVIYTNLKEV
jgi:hypothetical protein